MASTAACQSLLPALSGTQPRSPAVAALRPDPCCQLPCNAASWHSNRVRHRLQTQARIATVSCAPPAAAALSSLSSLSAPSHLAALSHGPCLSPRSGTPSGRQIEARRREEGIEPAQRVVAGLAYLLPLLDGIRYGRFLFQQYPFTEVVLQPILPLVQLYNSVPFSSLVAFFALYLLVVNNPRYSRYVRFNCYQAILLDILLILPGLVERSFSPSGGAGLEALILFYNTVFLFIFSCFAFGSISCLLGKEPRLPVVADAADAQVPF
ncbi:hypothetical protein KFL_007060030 [Klebsormidium nitens]|uniref:Protein TIC 20 n=1 Tax=Klebsormidium nitens TaxID=105231 RepID=A0A1Y1IQC8_KLENI|nr:hypothetical protein KFL_007060030 [Klebsormidium nitens]|eukprot:GAQ90946.1 hypothetical protein KFL_007060030 [Klebsormidium nitens]